MSTASGQRDGVLFLMRNPAYVRNFASVLSTLGARGHRTTVLFEERKAGGDEAGRRLIADLCGQYDSLSYELLPRRPLGVRGLLRMALSAGQDYLRYFDLPYRDATNLRSRALAPLPRRLERGLAGVLRLSPRGRRALVSAARRVDRRLGDDPSVRRELERRRPGVLLVTPMVHLRSRQSDWVRVAGRLGIRTMLCLYSWDNLTNKGLMHAMPDRIAVWNHHQRREAVELHRAEADSILVAGAWPYDHWFDWRVSRSRAELCRELGLPEDRALILYACSSRFIAERERPAVVRWVQALRASADPHVASANVIVRPHPLHADEWKEPSLEDLPGVAVFPPGGADPVDDSARSDYFDSISHADAVVGVNTSALVESAIVDRPALALPAPEFRSTQDELPHFRQLVGEEGMLRVSPSLEGHIAQLGHVLNNGAAEAAVRRRFVETFLRPVDGEASPTERLVAAVEELLRMRA
jgi:hypothetical protein